MKGVIPTMMTKQKVILLQLISGCIDKFANELKWNKS